MIYSEEIVEIPRIDDIADEQGIPSPEAIEKFKSLGRAALNFELPIFQIYVRPGQRNGYPAPLSTLGMFTLRESLEEVANEAYARIHGGSTRATFAFTHISPVRPYHQPMAADRLVPLEARTGGQLSPHTDAGFTGPSMHIQRGALAPGQEPFTREIWAAFAKPGHDVGWDPATERLSEIQRNYHRGQSIERQMRYKGEGFGDPEIAKHIDGLVYHGTTQPGVITVMIDGNMAPPYESPTPSTIHFFKDDKGRLPTPWVRFAMRYQDCYGHNASKLPLLRENFLQVATLEASAAEYMDLRQELQTSVKPGFDPYFWFSEQINAIRHAPNMTVGLETFAQNYKHQYNKSGHEAAVIARRVCHFLLHPGHDLVYTPGAGGNPDASPAYLSWPGDLRGKKPEPQHIQEAIFPMHSDKYRDPTFRLGARPPLPVFEPAGSPLHEFDR